MQHDFVADSHIAAYGQRCARVAVADAAILNIAPRANADAIGVAAQRGVEPDADMLAQDHITNDVSAGRDPSAGGNLWVDVI